MRTLPRYCYLLLVAYCLVSLGCEDDTIVVPSDCPYTFPTTRASPASVCHPDGVVVRELATVPDGPQPPYLRDCPGWTDLARTVEILPGQDDDVYVQVYNGASGTALVRIYGAVDCDNRLTSLTDCEEVILGKTIVVSGVSDFDKLFVRLELLPSGNGPVEGDDYLEIVVHDELPVLPQRGYHPTLTDSSGEIVTACDEASLERLVLGSCDTEVDLVTFITDLGLEVDERHAFPGGQIIAAIFPNLVGGNPRKASDAVAQKKADVNGGDDIEVNIDLLFDLPSDNGNRYAPGNDFLQEEQLDNCFRGIPFETPEAEEGRDNLVITIIDSGLKTDIAGGLFDRHRYYGPDVRNIASGSLGWHYYHDRPLNQDLLGHGTGVSSAVTLQYRGSRRGLSAVHLGIFGEQGESNYFSALCAVHDAVTLNSDVINMSWGIPFDGELPLLRCALERGQREGIVMITSAGNDDADLDESPQYPAAFASDPSLTQLFSVGAFRATSFNDDHFKAEFSNYSPTTRVDVMAHQAALAWSNDGGSFTYLAGTSYSAPLLGRVVVNLLGAGFSREVIPSLLQSEYFIPSTNLTSRSVNGSYLPICANGTETTP